MNWSLDDPRWLLLVLIGVACAAVGWRWMRAVPAMRRVPAVGARVLLALACALALAGLHADRRTDRVAVVAAVDISGSVRSFADFGLDADGRPLTAQEASWDLLARASADRRPDDPFGLVVFDGHVTALATPGIDDPLARPISHNPADGTDIPAAMRLARSLLPSDAEGRIVLISDGRTTRGSLDDITVDVPVDVAPISYTVDRETIVESFDLPARAASGAEVQGRVVLRSTGPARGVLTVLRDGRPIDLTPGEPGDGIRFETDEGGRHVVPVRFILPDGRLHRYEVVYEPDRATEGGRTVLFGDTSLANNRASAFTITRAPGAVLLVDGSGRADHGTLARTLRAAGREVEVTTPSAFPSDLLALEGFDLVVLENVPVDALPAGSDQRLDAYARDFGGGVIFVGGRTALTAGGWRGSAMEDALPIRLEIPDRVTTAEAAVLFVLDRSGSMSRPVLGSSQSQQEIANRAIAGAIDTLDPSDLVGVIAFSHFTELIVPLGPNDNPEQIKNRVLGINATGGTHLSIALELAIEQMRGVEARSKHVIVLSDGISLHPERMPGLSRTLLADGVKVSSIAVGDDADVDMLRTVAEEGGGIFYRVLNPAVLPQVFIRAIRVNREPAVREIPFNPVVLDPDAPAMTGVGQPPALGGLVLATRRDRAATPLVTPEDEPVVAYWPVELGRVAAVTTDADDWASNWVGTPGFSRFWTNLSAWTARAIDDTPGELRMVARGDTAELVYEAQGESGEPLDGMRVTVNLYLPEGGSREVELRQTGPGRYEGTARSLPGGVIVGAARAVSADRALPPAISGVSLRTNAEDQFLTSDEAGLARLAARTGGRVLDWNNPDDLFARFENPRVLRSALWPTLLGAAFVLFLLDVAMRRLAWDRWVESAREDTIAVTRQPEGSSLGVLRAGRAARPAGPVIEHDTDADRRRLERERTERLIAEARARAAAAQSRSQPPPEGSPPAQDAEGDAATDESGLQAAKRRARERFGRD
ncbi:MAG: VWA domain-containing protein [Phycisphaerales bacterium]|nr:VWA domain-containing protein [Phycisphaerales bacterium]